MHISFLAHVSTETSWMQLSTISDRSPTTNDASLRCDLLSEMRSTALTTQFVFTNARILDSMHMCAASFSNTIVLASKKTYLTWRTFPQKFPACRCRLHIGELKKAFHPQPRINLGSVAEDVPRPYDLEWNSFNAPTQFFKYALRLEEALLCEDNSTLIWRIALHFVCTIAGWSLKTSLCLVIRRETPSTALTTPFIECTLRPQHRGRSSIVWKRLYILRIGKCVLYTISGRSPTTYLFFVLLSETPSTNLTTRFMECTLNLDILQEARLCCWVKRIWLLWLRDSSSVHSTSNIVNWLWKRQFTWRIAKRYEYNRG